jgi:hypothetical protein
LTNQNLVGTASPWIFKFLKYLNGGKKRHLACLERSVIRVDFLVLIVARYSEKLLPTVDKGKIVSMNKCFNYKPGTVGLTCKLW